MGVPRPKRLLNGSVPRSKATWTKADIDCRHGIDGLKPHCIVYVNTGNARQRREWTLTVRHCGITVVETIGLGDANEHGHYYRTAYRIVGSMSQLHSVIMSNCVYYAHSVMSSRVPLGERLDEGGIPYVLKVTAQGDGPIKVRSSGKPSKPSKWVSGESESDNLKQAIADSRYTDFPTRLNA